MKSKKIRAVVVIGILIATLVAFIYFFLRHPAVIDRLKHLSPLLLLGLLGLYAFFTIALAIITHYSLAVGNARIPFRENILLTCYSSIINFFGPLQSGPGFRILYLKKKHNISAKDYTFATLLYYGFFALVSGLFVSIHVLPWWGTICVLTVITGLSLFVLRRKREAQHTHYSIAAIIQLGLITFLQIAVVAAIYFVELHSVDRHISLSQAITYTGVANFALFVSLTPGAIGFRESFLLFTQHLHHIGSSTILAASVIDRGVYVVFLGILFVLSLVFHLNDRLRTKKMTKQTTS